MKTRIPKRDRRISPKAKTLAGYPLSARCRNLSPHQMFKELANAHVPECSFIADTDFANWKAETWPRVVAALGVWPEAVDANPELLAEWTDEGVLKQKWLIDVGPYISATFLINYPPGLGAQERRPSILCWHGHEKPGKDQLMGNWPFSDTADRSGAYGHQMAQEGFVTYAIDWMGGGERNDTGKPHFSAASFGRDWCNLYYLLSTMLGFTSLSMNLSQAKSATDFALSLPGVDASRMGVMGASGGGTMALWSALCDERFKAVEIICYSGLWRDFLFHDLNACGMQVAPGLFKLVDVAELQGLLAPRPLLIDIGAYDDCFPVDAAISCYRKLEQIYAAAKATGSLELDLSPGGHRWPGRRSADFFRRQLI